MTLKTPLPEKFEGLKSSPESRYTTYTTEQATINQLIDHVKELGEMIDQEKWDRDNEYARGFNDGAFEQNKINDIPTLKEQLLGEIKRRSYHCVHNDHNAIKLDEVEAIINKLLP